MADARIDEDDEHEKLDDEDYINLFESVEFIEEDSAGVIEHSKIIRSTLLLKKNYLY